MSSAPTPLSSSINKLLHAKRLFGDVEQLYMSYLMSQPYQLTATASAADHGYLVTTNYTPPPAELALVFGDFVHNLRCALDHLARELVIKGGGTPDDGPGGTMFPVLLKQGTTPFQVKAKKGGPTSGDLALLESIQPYLSNSPSGHPLHQINRLDNIDKHRHINIAVLAATAHVAFREADTNEPITDETPRYLIDPAAGDTQTIQVNEPLIDGEVAVQGTHVSHVVLQEPSLYSQPANIVGTCRGFYDFVATKVFALWYS